MGFLNHAEIHIYDYEQLMIHWPLQEVDCICCHGICIFARTLECAWLLLQLEILFALLQEAGTLKSALWG